MAGDNYTFKMPTEELKTELEAVRAELARTEAKLRVALTHVCPDPDCPNCQKWNNWHRNHGDVLWKACQTCQAGAGEPCRHIGRGVGGGYPPVLRRPHRGREGALRPGDSPL